MAGEGNITLTVYDMVNNSASVILPYGIDVTDPAFSSVVWVEGSDYLYVDTGTLIFSNAMAIQQGASATWTVTDNIRLETMEYSDETSSNVDGPTAIVPLTGTSQSSYGVYYFDASSVDTDTPVTLTLRDHVGNSVTANLAYRLDDSVPVAALDMDNHDIIFDDYFALEQDPTGWYVNVSGQAIDAGGAGVQNVEISIDGMIVTPVLHTPGWALWWYHSTPLNETGWHNIEWTISDRVGNSDTGSIDVYRPHWNATATEVRSLNDEDILDLRPDQPFHLWLQVQTSGIIWLAIDHFGDNPTENEDPLRTGFHYFSMELADETPFESASLRVYYRQQELDNENLTEDDLLGIGFYNEISGEWELYADTGVVDLEPAVPFGDRNFEGFLEAELDHLTLLAGFGDTYKISFQANGTMYNTIFHELYATDEFIREYSVVVMNEGTETDSYDLTATGPAGWKLKFGTPSGLATSTNKVDYELEDVESGEVVEVILYVQIIGTKLNRDCWQSPDLPGRIYFIDLEIVSQNDPTKDAFETLEAEILRPDMEIEISASVVTSILYGSEIELYAYVTNNGNWTKPGTYSYNDPVTGQGVVRTTRDIYVIFEYLASDGITWIKFGYDNVYSGDTEGRGIAPYGSGYGHAVFDEEISHNVDTMRFRATIWYNPDGLSDEYEPTEMVGEVEVQLHPNVDEISFPLVDKTTSATSFNPALASLAMAAGLMTFVRAAVRRKEEDE
ncbi:MAG: hypothetical protein L0Z54_02655 [Thermoplasmata archaeon]|nr:hypothetical protein [Thermoplasmata archaeon]